MTVDSARNDDQNDGADVARNPEVIQREIEQTRAELADTIDAIADRISPKRAASRGAAAVKAQVSSVFSGGSDHAPAAVLDASPEQANAGRAAGVRAIASSGGGSQYTGTTQYGVTRSLRTDRVLVVVGAGAAAAALVVLWRSRS